MGEKSLLEEWAGASFGARPMRDNVIDGTTPRKKARAKVKDGSLADPFVLPNMPKLVGKDGRLTQTGKRWCRRVNAIARRIQS